MVAAHPLRRLSRVAVVVLALGYVGVSAAHPFHASYAELSWNDAGDTLQVALRVIPEDLETALSRTAGRRIVLDPEAPPAALVEAYLDRHFRVTADAAGTAPGVRFLGLDVAHDETWLYFTVPLAREAMPLTLTNSVLFDVAEAQSNRVRRLWAPDAPVLVFTAAEPSQLLPVHR